MIYLGQSLRRFEDHRLLTGQSQFVDDITLPDMLHAVVLRSPHAHATITAIDVAAARHATGVVAVVTASDLEQVAAHIPTRRNADPIARPLDCASRSLTPILTRTGDDDGHGTCQYCRIR